ncbi:nitrate- and nitrite sensing domain-containing protein [Streptomyces sp. NPDC090021]|uniref:sensor histidine kinase n=1 Tax=Streptomyces sp. NPDC090021 TaxID=3365919 RepID=UPI003802DB9E
MRADHQRRNRRGTETEAATPTRGKRTARATRARGRRSTTGKPTTPGDGVPTPTRSPAGSGAEGGTRPEAADAPVGAKASTPRGLRRLRDTRVRTRLYAVMAIPLVAAGVLGGTRVGAALDQAGRYEQFHDMAGLTRTGTELIQQLQRERNLVIDPQASSAAGSAGLAQAREATDALQRRFDGQAADLEQTGRLRTHLDAIAQSMAKLPEIRAMVDRGVSGSQADTAYLGLIMPLLGIDNELDGQLNQSHSQGWALYTLALANSMLSSEHALMSQAVHEGKLSTDQKAALLATVKVRDMAQREFSMAADPTDRAAYERINKTSDTGTAEAGLQALLASPEDLKKGDRLPADWYADFGTRVDQLDRLAIATADRLIAESEHEYDDAQTQAVIDAALTAGLIAVALGLAFAVSRGISEDLRRLRAAALRVAAVDLPRVMDELKDKSAAEVDLTVPPPAVDSGDDIGEVAEAFHQVHREAVRLAEDQARLRESVSLLFRNLSHRNRSLVQRQLAVLTTLEQNETDDTQLKSLFEVDHLAARMRRNSENLLVLAGGRPSSRPAAPMSLLDVVRTAMSEVEQFERVGHVQLPPVNVAGHAVSDVVHLLSELLENALMFSSPQSEVRVGAQRLPDGRTLIEVRDIGIGIEPDRLEQVNSYFTDRQGLVPDASEHMGLYVVGLLAKRHGIEVSLRPADPGVSALVVLPAEVVTRAAKKQPDTGEITAAPIMPTTSAAPAIAPLGTPDSGPPAADPEHPGRAAVTSVAWHADQEAWHAEAEARQAGPVQQEPPAARTAAGGRPALWSPTSLPRIPTGLAADPLPGADARPYAATPSAYEGPATAPSAPAEATGAFPKPGHPAIVDPATVRRPYGPGVGAPTGIPAAAPAPHAGDGTPVDIAAEHAQQHSHDPSGLPRRVPMANLLPGSVTPGAPHTPPPALAHPDPARLRSRLGALHDGIARAHATPDSNESEATA